MTPLEVLVGLAAISVAFLVALGIVGLLRDAPPHRRIPPRRGNRGYPATPRVRGALRTASEGPAVGFRPRGEIDTSGYGPVVSSVPPWDPGDSLETIAESWKAARTQGDRRSSTGR